MTPLSRLEAALRPRPTVATVLVAAALVWLLAEGAPLPFVAVVAVLLSVVGLLSVRRVPQERARRVAQVVFGLATLAFGAWSALTFPALGAVCVAVGAGTLVVRFGGRHYYLPSLVLVGLVLVGGSWYRARDGPDVVSLALVAAGLLAFVQAYRLRSRWSLHW